MQNWLLELLRCPKTGQRLEVCEARVTDDNYLIEGTLRTKQDGSVFYQVSAGVPNLMEPATSGSVTQTLDIFGTEWRDFANWGWIDDPGSSRESALTVESGLSTDSNRSFLAKTGHSSLGTDHPDLGKLVVDCGCGNGRFSREASKYANRVVAIDASVAAEVAFDNMRRAGITNVGVVRGSVLEMPLPDNCADYAFSIGVLQHTGNAPQMISEMTRIVPDGHRISINCYGQGRRSYEAVDRFIRGYTTKLSQDAKLKFSKRLAWIDRKLLLGPKLVRSLEKRLRRIMVLRPTVVQMYDWYAPKIAEHYAPEDLHALFEQNNLSVIAATHPITDPNYDDRRRKRNAEAYSFLLKKGG